MKYGFLEVPFKCRRRIPARLSVPKTLHIPFDSPIVIIGYGA